MAIVQELLEVDVLRRYLTEQFRCAGESKRSTWNVLFHCECKHRVAVKKKGTFSFFMIPRKPTNRSNSNFKHSYNLLLEMYLQVGLQFSRKQLF